MDMMSLDPDQVHGMCTKPQPNPVLPSTVTQQHYAANKPLSTNQSLDSCALGLSDMDSCWIKVLEPDALSAMALQQQLFGQNERINDLHAKLDDMAAHMKMLVQHMEALVVSSTQVKPLRDWTGPMEQLTDNVAEIKQHVAQMQTNVHEQHAYLMARRNKKAKTVKYVF